MKTKALPRTLAVFALLVLLGVISYWPSFSAPFVFDDLRNIVNNYGLHLDNFSSSELSHLWHSIGHNRALSMLSFALNYYFGKLNPFGYHLLNLLIHLLAALSLYGLTLSTLGLPKIRERYQDLAHSVALLSSFLFLLHPVNTNAVTYIVQRQASMACLFFLLTLLFYLWGRQSPTAKGRCVYWWLAGLSAVCAFASKENSATLPLFIILYELCFFPKTPKQRYFLWALLLLPAALAYQYTRFDLSRVLATAASQRHITYSQHLLTQARVISHYLSLLIYPHPGRLNLDYDFTYSRGLFSPPGTAFSLLLLLGLIAMGVYLARRRPFICLAIAWFLGNLAIESGLVLADIIFEHRLYLPAIGGLWIVSLGLLTTWKRFVPSGSAWSRPGGVLALAALLALLGTWTYQRNLVWADPVSLWQDTVNKSPGKARPHNNLGKAYSSRQEYSSALSQYQQALDLDPGHSRAYHNLGVSHTRRGEYLSALAEYKQALKLDPTFAQTYHNMGVLYAKLGNDREAVKYYQNAIKYNPGLLEAHNNLANSYLRLGEYKRALAGFELLIRKDPYFPVAHNSLGTAYYKLGQLDKAIRYLRRALQINPSFGEARLNLGAAYAQQGKYQQAYREYKEALRLMPRSPEVHYNLGRLYSLQGKAAQARKAYRQALQYNPDLAPAYFGLGKLASSLGEYQEAIEAYKKGLWLQPEWIEGYNELGNAYYMADRYQEAIEAYEQALTLNPSLMEVHNNLGLVYAALGRYQEAIKQHQKALEKDPQSASAHRYLGFVYLYYLKQPVRALPHLRKSLELAPRQAEAKQLQVAIQNLEAKHNTH